MRRLLCCLITLASMFAAASTRAVLLVDQRGAPIGGQWQQWADQAKVPTVPGSLSFSIDAHACGALGCSWGPPWDGSQRGTAVAPGVSARAVLYFELGHQFDWELLTWTDRQYLEQHWRILNPAEPYPFARLRWWHWLDTAASVRRHGENGMEAMFALIYADCAMGADDRGAALTPIEPAGVSMPTVIPQINTCDYISRIARR